MKRSPLRHPVAVLRQIIGLGQKELAELVGRSRRTIQAIELGSLKLSVELADKLVRETSVAFHWLMNGDAEAPPISTAGTPYVREDFELTQGEKIAGLPKPGSEEDPCGLVYQAFCTLMPLIMPMIASDDRVAQVLMIYRLNDLLKDLVGIVGWPSDEITEFIAQCRFEIITPEGDQLSIPSELFRHVRTRGVGAYGEIDMDEIKARIRAGINAPKSKGWKAFKETKGRQRGLT